MADAMENLLDLPLPLLERIIGDHCDVRTVAHVSMVCRALHSFAAGDGLWLRMCHRDFTATDARLWKAGGGSPGLPVAIQSTCMSYKAVYSTLTRYQHLVGVWRCSGNVVRSTLYEFHWEPDRIAGTVLTFDSMGLQPLRAAFESVGPDARVLPELIGNTHCVLRVFIAAPTLRMPSRAAESAAAVAIAGYGGSPTGEVVLGSSPEGSFEHEMLRFMQGNVAGNRQRRRKAARSPVSHSGGDAGRERVHHLVRVARPLPSRRHPLAGLYKADYGANSIQIVCLAMDFTGPVARIVAVKVTGDNHVPAGKTTWHANAAAIEQPWSPAEASLIDLRTQFVEADAGQGEAPEQARPRHVAACYMGKGKIAGLGYLEARWVEGRLWQFDNDHIGFLWLDTLLDFLLVELTRIDSQLR